MIVTLPAAEMQERRRRWCVYRRLATAPWLTTSAQRLSSSDLSGGTGPALKEQPARICGQGPQDAVYENRDDHAARHLPVADDVYLDIGSRPEENGFKAGATN
jgi:hypothetical protein